MGEYEFIPLSGSLLYKPKELILIEKKSPQLAVAG